MAALEIPRGSLSKELTDLGVFDTKMSPYLLYRLREFSTMEFSGFEVRHYSLFESIVNDMGKAADIQTLITALAYKYIVRGQVTHLHIPDEPSLESERRQIFFGAAIGIPTFYVRQDSRNQFIKKILQKKIKTRISHRYPGYIRVYNREYCKALIALIKEDAADLIELMNLKETIHELQKRIENFQTFSAAGKLTRGILNTENVPTPMKLSDEEFNRAAENYSRDVLRKNHLEEAFNVLEDDIKRIESSAGDFYTDMIKNLSEGKSAAHFLAAVKKEVLEEKASADLLTKLIYLTLVSIRDDKQRSEPITEKAGYHELSAPSVY